MKIATFSLVAAALFSPVVSIVAEPNPYFNGVATTKFRYSNFVKSGWYNAITEMNDNGECRSEPKEFNSTLGPLAEEVVLAFRGPIHVNEVSVFLPGDDGVFKRDAEGLAKRKEEQCNQYEHHSHKHSKRKLVQVTETVLVYEDEHGKPISPSTPAGGAATGAPAPDSDSSPSFGPDSSSSSDSDSSSSAEGGYERISHWRPDKGVAKNCSFLNHKGGRGSGVWSEPYGNSLSWANKDNTDASVKSEILGDVLIPSNSEFLFMSGLLCGDKSEKHDCGYYRPGTVALHGFGGDCKIFIIEFLMPDTMDVGFNANKPAVWLLHRDIVLTLQYGKPDCSCWPGCGELDLFEILNSGEKNMITAYHGRPNGSGGSPNYIPRPEGGPIKTAVIMKDGHVHVMQIDYNTAIGDVLSKSQVDAWVNAHGTEISVY